MRIPTWIKTLKRGEAYVFGVALGITAYVIAGLVTILCRLIVGAL